MREAAAPHPRGAQCAHCELPVRVRANGCPDEAVYCCTGCRIAAAVSGGRGEHGLVEARLLVAAFLAMGVMTVSLVLYGEAVYDASAAEGMDAIRGVGRAGLALFALPVLLLLVPPLLRGAVADLRRGRVHMDGLIVLAVLAAYGLSVAHTLTGTGEVYYDTATMVLVLVTFGRRLEAHARVRGRDAGEALLGLLPPGAHREKGTSTEDVDPSELVPGNVVRVLPGEAVPADVVVVDGTSDVSAAHLTGEEATRAVSTGDTLAAGSVNRTGALRARVVRAALDGSLGRIRELLETPLGRTEGMRSADRLAGVLAAVAVALAVAGGARSWWLGGTGEGIRTALSVLLVACPCALGLATPLAYRAIRAALAKRGVLVRSVTALEEAQVVDTVLLDKTGTLTDPRRTRVAAQVGGRVQAARLVALVAHSGHALGTALPRGGLMPGEVNVVPGSGVEGSFDGTSCRAGRPEWLDGAEWAPDVAAERTRRAGDGTTLVAYESGGRVTALAALEHELRPSTKDGVATLTDRGLAVEVLSGDRAAAAGRLGEALGVDALGDLEPADKLARVEALRAAGRAVLMAGDGVNDAPALRAAHVGVAVGDATAPAREQADVELVSGDVGGVAAFLEAAGELRRAVRANLRSCVVYNTVALLVAASGHLHPLIAVVAMIVSSLAVSTRSYGLLDWEPAATGGAGAAT